MNANQKRLIRLLAGAAVYAAALLLHPENGMILLGMFLAAYLVVGGDVVLSALRNILRGQVFDENFLMCLATAGAFLIGEYPEGVAVMLFYQVGELFQSHAVGKSRASIAELMNIRPDYANVRRGDALVRLDPDEVRVGEIIIVKAGERIPLDARVIEGSSSVDASALTGESVPREIGPGDELLSGCVNQGGLLTAEVTKEYGDSTAARILELVENASGKKSRSEHFITKFARWYTPAVVVAAALLAVLPPLLIRDATFSDWVYRALTFLVISCPCALVISVPLSFFGGIGGASKRGILVKGGNYLEALAKTEIVVFDKTGTLTKGVFGVRQIEADILSKEALLELATHAEAYSGHPIALSLRRAYGKEPDRGRIGEVRELAGYGVRAVVDGKEVLAGNAGLMQQNGIACREAESAGTVAHIAVDGVYAGFIVIADEIREDAAHAIVALRRQGVKETVMLTGDVHSVGERVAAELGIGRVYAGLLPDGKVERVERLMEEKSRAGKLVFVGDGINDAPVLARADIGVAMGGLGSDAAIEAADVVIMTDEPSKLVTAIAISRRTLRIVRQNIIFALAVKAAVLLLGALGISTMWEAVFADVGVSVLAILNAMRVLNVKSVV